MSNMKTLVDGFLGEQRIAVVGVRREVQDAANSIYKKLKDSGYQVFAVNPKAQEIEGDPCYPDIASIPGGVGAAMLVTRPEISTQVVKDAVAAGVKHVWMHRSIGNSISEEAVQYCREHGVSVIPGGCPMMFVPPVDFGHKCMKAIGKFAGWMPK